jgi:hypothetical protein
MDKRTSLFYPDFKDKENFFEDLNLVSMLRNFSFFGTDAAAN